MMFPYGVSVQRIIEQGAVTTFGTRAETPSNEDVESPSEDLSS